jgi:alkanesulfonate monooxygenase SsuD/methylene tetrahydromethanopterin reductase-like flavin-dependent oxidoreductase (luciferase family)
MELGLFFDLRNPQRWERPWPELYGRTIELVERAEQLGAGSVWFTEHHRFADGYLPQPLTFAAAVAARTSRVRIGTAVLLAALRNPVLIAEEAAVVDQLSGGRLELGFGAGYVRREYDLYGVDIARRYGLTDAAVVEVRRLFDDGVVTPPPAQRPVPLWLGYQGPQGARRAGRLGVGLLSLDPALLEPYHAGLAEGGHDPAVARTGGMLDIVVSDDPEPAFARILPHLLHQANTYAEAAAAGTGAPPRVLTEEKVLSRRTGPASVPGLRVLTPGEAVDAVRAATSHGPVAHVYFWASIAGMADDLVDRHVELLLGEVAPALRSGAEGG